jgi:hypothetical protein
MKKISLLLLLCANLLGFSQNFEGKIVYENNYKSKSEKITDQQFNSMMGTKQEFYIKNGNYKSVVNGTYMLWQLYLNNDNKIYSQMANIPSVLWTDAAIANEQIIKSEIKKNAAKILNYDCSELTLTCKSGVQKYYFSSKFPIDAKVFEKHKYGNWYDYLVKANAVPLKSVIETAQFTLTSTATEVTPMKVEDSMFELPANVKTEKSPY